MLIFLSICRFGEPQVPQTCIYSKKSNILIGKSHQTCIYSKKIKKFDSEKSPNLHILKKIKKIKNQVIYASESHIESEIFDFFDFFEYMQVWRLFTIKTFDFFEYMQVFCTFGIKMLIFLSICRFGEPQVPQTCIYSKKSKK